VLPLLGEEFNGKSSGGKGRIKDRRLYVIWWMILIIQEHFLSDCINYGGQEEAAPHR